MEIMSTVPLTYPNWTLLQPYIVGGRRGGGVFSFPFFDLPFKSRLYDTCLNLDRLYDTCLNLDRLYDTGSNSNFSRPAH